MKKERKIVEQQTNSKPKKIRRKTIIIYSSIGAGVIALGAAGGILAGSYFWKAPNPYASLDIDTVEVDYAEVYEKFKQTTPEKALTEFSDVELVNIAYLQLQDIDNFYSISTGSVKAAGVTQSILSTLIKNDQNYFEENLTESMFVKGANRFYQDETNVKWYKGKYSSGTGNYSKAKIKDYTIDEFDEEWGKTLNHPLPYIVTNKTCMSHTRTNNSDGSITFTLELDPTYSVLKYVKTMVMNGGLEDPPVFHSINMSLTIDKNIYIQKYENDEIYDVHMVIDAKNSHATLIQNFHYEERAIPNFDEQTNYD